MMSDDQPVLRVKPCPTCGGDGVTSEIEYSDGTFTLVECHTCGGDGVVSRTLTNPTTTLHNCATTAHSLLRNLVRMFVKG
jgi:DnaJ-class molecular chaperone